MKKIILSALILTAMVCSCSSTFENENATSIEQTETTGNTVFKFSSSAISVTASRSTEDSYTNEQGTESEWKVNNVRIYLFDTKTKLFAKTYLLKNLTRTNDGKSGYVTYTSDRVMLSHGTYDIFAVANSNSVISTETEGDFINNIDGETYKIGNVVDTSNGIVMSNRASANLATEIKSYEDNSTDNVVEITLERVVARVDVATKADKFELADGNNAVYATVSIESYHLVNLAKKFYTYRHVATLTSMQEPKWDIFTHFGNVDDVNGYVIDPYFFKKSIDASAFNNEDSYYENFFLTGVKGNGVKWTNLKAAATTPSYNTSYCLENCTMQAAQKNGYSTGVVFRCAITPNNNVYGVAASGELVKIAKENYPTVMYYYNHKFYNSTDALAKEGVVVREDMTTEDLDFLDVKKYENEDGKYYAYYTYWIRHLDNNSPLVMGVMEFAIVRNNLYRLLVTGISDLGPSTPNPGGDTPDEGEAYLRIQLNVKPWVIREQQNIVL